MEIQLQQCTTLVTPPTIVGPIAPQGGLVGSPVNLDKSPLFAGEGITYSLINPHGTMVINASTGFITGNLPTSVGTYTSIVRATNAGGFVDCEVTWTVIAPPPPNNAPVKDGVPIPDQSVSTTETVSIDFGASFSDPDGDTLTFSINTVPPGTSFNATNGELNGTPTAVGVYPLSVVANDGTDNSIACTMTLTVTDPVADVEVNKAVDVGTPIEGQDVTFTVTATNNGPDDVADLLVTESVSLAPLARLPIVHSPFASL